MTPPPPIGLCIPVQVASETYQQGIHDGDTVKLHPSWSKLVFALRILDCWCPEVQIRGKAKEFSQEKKDRILRVGQAARDELSDLLSNRDLRFAVPFEIVQNYNIFDMLTFGRVLGHLWADEIHVAQHLVGKGLAFRTKQECIDAGLA